MFTGEVEKIVESHAQAVFLAGGEGAGHGGAVARAAQRRPDLLLLGSSAMASESFASQIGAAAANTYLTTPVLATRLYPPAAQQVLSRVPQRLRSRRWLLCAVRL